MKGNLFIISSPSGGGKGTLIKKLLEEVPNVSYSVSYTTRQARDGEENGKDYIFVSGEEFKRLIAEDEFIEYAVVHGNFYGTSRSKIEKETSEGKDVILEIDVQGARIIREKVPDAIGVFIRTVPGGEREAVGDRKFPLSGHEPWFLSRHHRRQGWRDEGLADPLRQDHQGPS